MPWSVSKWTADEWRHCTSPEKRTPTLHLSAVGAEVGSDDGDIQSGSNVKVGIRLTQGGPNRCRPAALERQGPKYNPQARPHIPGRRIEQQASCRHRLAPRDSQCTRRKTPCMKTRLQCKAAEATCRRTPARVRSSRIRTHVQNRTILFQGATSSTRPPERPVSA